MKLSVGMRLGDYEVRPLEGIGATAEVYRAIDTRLHREVALKIVGTDATGRHDTERIIARLEREAWVLASLDHPNIARLYGLEAVDGVRALVLELVEGPTLQDRLAAGPLVVVHALDVARQVAAALEAAHERGIVHRDLKPSNIKLPPDGPVKVLDFGLARVRSGPAPFGGQVTATITADGVAVGTAAYMSPEQARGERVDEKTDIWAFGCVTYEMLTGIRAFPGDDQATTLAAVLRSEPDWARLPPELPATAGSFLRRCLVKDPSQRVRHIGDVRLAFEGAFESESPPSEASTARPGPAPFRRGLLWAACGLLAGMAFGVGWPTTNHAPGTPASYIIHPPEGAAFNDAMMEPYPEVSPDGQSVAYLAWTGVADRAVWVQRLGDLTPRQLAGTELRGEPFWSPDGRFVGMSGVNGIATIGVESGSVLQAVCSCVASFGASWGRDGTILFANDEGISRVSAAGGPVTTVTAVATDRGEFSHRFPAFLPDGRHFLYLVRSTNAERRGIHVASLDDASGARRLLPDDSSVDLAHGPDGRTYLVYVRDVTLVAQRFDPERLVLMGTPVVIAPRVVPGDGGRRAPFSAGGRSLVYRQSHAPETRLRWFDRHGVPQPGLDRRGSFQQLALSPSGERAVVSSADPDSTKRDVWIHDLRRNVSERLTFDPISATYPVWTPDEHRVIYASASEGPWHIFWRASERPDQGRLYAALAPSTKYPSDVAPDGTELLFSGGGAIWALPLASPDAPRRLISGSDGDVSPDGRWLAYVSSESGLREVYVTSFPQPGASWRVSTDGGEQPRWRHDGRELYYLNREQILTAATLAFTPRFAVAAVQPLFHVALDRRSLRFGPSYAPSPDGLRFLVNERVRDHEIVLTAVQHWSASGH